MISAGRARRVLWAAVLSAAVALLGVAVLADGGAETDQARIQRLSASYACPECQGESVAESSAAVAANIRQFIADEVAAGATDQQIRDALVRSYGARVLLNPPAEGLATLLWVLPVLLVVLGAGVIAAVFDRARVGDGPLTDADRELVDAARAERSASVTSESGGDGPAKGPDR